MNFGEALSYVGGYTLAWLPPVGGSDPYEVRAGRTVPVMFTLADAEGSFAVDESVSLSLVAEDGSTVVGPVGLAPSPWQGIAIRGQHYKYQLRTKGLAAGTYTLSVSYNSTIPGEPAAISIAILDRWQHCTPPFKPRFFPGWYYGWWRPWTIYWCR